MRRKREHAYGYRWGSSEWSIDVVGRCDECVAGGKLTRLIGRVEATVEAVGLWLPALHLRYGIIEYTVSVLLTLQIGT